MKQLLVVVFVAIAGVILSAPLVHADVNDFRISSYDIRYTLGRDDEGRSTLKTVETIVADFPNFDQNHGLERAIPLSYDGHPTSLNIQSVTNGNSKLDYSTDENGDNAVLRIGDPDEYVHGRQTYQITYIQRDVTRFFDNTSSDEFYWDTNGVDWRVPIDKLTVRLDIDSSLASALNDKASCYRGYADSTDQCVLVRDGTTFTTSATGLAQGENITIALGFASHTFNEYKEPIWSILMLWWFISWGVLGVAGAVIIAWISVRWTLLTKRTKEIGTIVPEYLPPSQASVTASASVTGGTKNVFAAQLLDFAVRHYVKIYELDKKGIFGSSKDYKIEIIRDIADLQDEEQEVLSDIFGKLPKIGDELVLSSLKNNTKLYTRIQDNSQKLQKLVRGEYNLRHQDPKQAAWFKKAAKTLLVVAIVTLNPVLLILSFIAFVLALTFWPLTDKGLNLARYLQGLKMYISVAEVERLKLLQSPDGAEKVQGVDPTNKEQLVKLYERVLPYAVLFGQEKQWNKQIGNLYEESNRQPDWYSSNTAFSAVAFGSVVHGFSTSASYSAASSSSSGGSGGGGSSGGGGGGGGGGGW